MSTADERLRPDTIVAIATPPGVGALAVLRVSGPEAFGMVEALLDDGADPDAPPRTAMLRELRDPTTGEALDRVLVTRFPGPDSYTGEDLVEISTHGGHVAPRLVRKALVDLGARPARAGEFTQRAWLNGKLDLIQAEAIADLVEGSSRALHRVALLQLDRGLSRRVSELREGLVELEATLAHHVDFPDEDDAPTPIGEIADRADTLAARFRRLASTAPTGRRLRSGATVVLAGRPNAGKSSLLNGLVGEERAIVNERPGTTRDRIEVELEIGGLPFRLVDTAGLRETGDEIEKIGVEVARSALAAADVVLYCIPLDAEPTDEDLEFLREHSGAPMLIARTRADLARPGTQLSVEGSGQGEFVTVAVSVVSGEGLDGIREALSAAAFEQPVLEEDPGSVLTRERQVRGVGIAAEEIEAFGAALRRGIPPEVAAAHLKDAASASEELLGAVGIEDVLDRVFSDFCVGK